MTRVQAEALAVVITGLDSYRAERVLVGAGLTPAAAAAVVYAHLGVVSKRVQGHLGELASWIYREWEVNA